MYLWCLSHLEEILWFFYFYIIDVERVKATSIYKKNIYQRFLQMLKNNQWSYN